MKKNVLTLSAVVVFTIAVPELAGMSNASPKSTLDITGTMAVTVADSVLVPHFTTSELTGVLVYKEVLVPYLEIEYWDIKKN